jgi:hypothetical protein
MVDGNDSALTVCGFVEQPGSTAQQKTRADAAANGVARITDVCSATFVTASENRAAETTGRNSHEFARQVGKIQLATHAERRGVDGCE